jgi:hypothetical protein
MPRIRLVAVAVAVVAVVVVVHLISVRPAAAQEGVRPEAQVTQEAATEEAATDRTPRVSGYLQTFYRTAFETGEDEAVDNDNFRVQRVRVKLEGDVRPWLSYDVEIDPRAPEVAGVLRDAFVSFKVIPRHKIRVGQQKTQFGYENRESSSRLFAVNRTEVSDNLSRGVNLRDVGVGLLGDVKLGGGWRLEDAVTVTNGAPLGSQNDDTAVKNVWGRLGVRWKLDDDTWVRAGASGGVGDYVDEGDDEMDLADDFRVEFRRVGGDIEVETPWVFASSEVVWGRDEAFEEADEPAEVSRPSGWYVNLVGKTPWRVGPIVRYDALDDESQRWTTGGYYGMADDAVRVLVNHEYRRKKDGERGDDKLYLWLQVRF